MLGAQFADAPKHGNRSSGARVVIFCAQGSIRDSLIPLSTVIVLLVFLCLFFVLGGRFAVAPKHGNRPSGALVFILRARGSICCCP